MISDDSYPKNQESNFCETVNRDKPVNVLVLGSGGREHAIAEKFSTARAVGDVFIVPGSLLLNKGEDYSYVKTFDDIYSFIFQKKIKLVFVGNEQYLADGIVDYLREKEIDVVGPSRVASQIEYSKIWAKNLMVRCDVPTANYQCFIDSKSAIGYLDSVKYPIVIKADGLAAGKGVIIAENREVAEVTILDMLSGKSFGRSGEQIVIEEFLTGEEASIFAFCDGQNFVSTIFCQDHKAAYDGDTGPNTGGMGAFAPVDKFSHLKSKVDSTIFRPILDGMVAAGCPFTGVLFAGLMISDDDIKVIEFNCRLGDPETQVLLPLLDSDFYELCRAIIEERISEIQLSWSDYNAVGVCLASIGYPNSFEKGLPISIPSELHFDDSLHIYYAGIGYDPSDDVYQNTGGRVLCVTCLGETLAEAIEHVYKKVPLIKSDILRYRTDIGKKGLA
jgi:phosphoribosylamine--glycine ligase